LPTIPIVTLQLYAIHNFHEMADLFKKALAHPKITQRTQGDDSITITGELLTLKQDDLHRADNLAALVSRLRRTLGNATPISEVVTEILMHDPGSYSEMLRALVSMYSSESSLQSTTMALPLQSQPSPITRQLKFWTRKTWHNRQHFLKTRSY
jgi:hypothetical protein